MPLPILAGVWSAPQGGRCSAGQGFLGSWHWVPEGFQSGVGLGWRNRSGLPVKGDSCKGSRVRNAQNCAGHQGAIRCDPSAWYGHGGLAGKAGGVELRDEGLLKSLNLAVVFTR